MLFRRRDLLVCQRTQTINALRGHLAEFGIAAPQGVAHVARLAQALGGSGIAGSGALLFDRIVALDAEIAGLAKEVGEAAGRDDDAARLMIIPGGRRSPRWRCGTLHRRSRASGAAGTLPPGWALCRASTRPGAIRDWAGS